MKFNHYVPTTRLPFVFQLPGAQQALHGHQHLRPLAVAHVRHPDRGLHRPAAHRRQLPLEGRQDLRRKQRKHRRQRLFPAKASSGPLPRDRSHLRRIVRRSPYRRGGRQAGTGRRTLRRHDLLPHLRLRTGRRRQAAGARRTRQRRPLRIVRAPDVRRRRSRGAFARRRGEELHRQRRDARYRAFGHPAGRPALPRRSADEEEQ